MRIVIDQEAWLAAIALIRRHGAFALDQAIAKAANSERDGDLPGELAWELVAMAVREATRGPHAGDTVH